MPLGWRFRSPLAPKLNHFFTYSFPAAAAAASASQPSSSFRAQPPSSSTFSHPIFYIFFLALLASVYPQHSQQQHQHQHHIHHHRQHQDQSSQIRPYYYHYYPPHFRNIVPAHKPRTDSYYYRHQRRVPREPRCHNCTMPVKRTAAAAAYADACPPACNGSVNPCSNYYLREGHVSRVCDGRDFYPAIEAFRLEHCCEHSLAPTLPGDQERRWRQRRSNYEEEGARFECETHVRGLIQLDQFVGKVMCQFRQLLRRYDCRQKYSVSHCHKCRETYRKWVCSSLIPHWRSRKFHGADRGKDDPDERKVKPCRSVCHAVEQNCPWFLPADNAPGYQAQYAGEPIFQCIDPNIPETGGQLAHSSYGNAGCCYEYCPKTSDGICVKGCEDEHHDHHNGIFPPFLDTGSYQRKQFPATLKQTNVSSKECGNGDDKSGGGGFQLATTPATRTVIPFFNIPLSSCPSSHLPSKAVASRRTSWPQIVPWAGTFATLGVFKYIM